MPLCHITIDVKIPKRVLAFVVIAKSLSFCKSQKLNDALKSDTFIRRKGGGGGKLKYEQLITQTEPRETNENLFELKTNRMIKI